MATVEPACDRCTFISVAVCCQNRVRHHILRYGAMELMGYAQKAAFCCASEAVYHLVIDGAKGRCSSGRNRGSRGLRR